MRKRLPDSHRTRCHCTTALRDLQPRTYNHRENGVANVAGSAGDENSYSGHSVNEAQNETMRVWDSSLGRTTERAKSLGVWGSEWGKGGEEGGGVEVVMPMPVDRVLLQMGGRNGFVRYFTVLIEWCYHQIGGAKGCTLPPPKADFPLPVRSSPREELTRLTSAGWELCHSNPRCCVRMKGITFASCE